MTKIGSNSGSDQPNGLNSRKLHAFQKDSEAIPQDPFIGIEMESADGWNFHNFSRLITWGLANEWFAEFDAVPAMDYLRQKCGDGLAEWMEARVSGLNWFKRASIRPEFLIDSHGLGTIKPLDTGSLSPTLLSYLTSRDVISHEFAVTYTDKKLIKVAQPMLWSAVFSTSFGTRCVISVESHIDQFGVERCHLFTNLAVGTRAPNIFFEMATGDVQGIEKVRSNFTLPLFMSRLMYLAETPLPNSLFSMSRSLAFKDVLTSLIPKPIMSVENYSIAFSHSSPNAGETEIDIDIYPQVMRIGYEITSDMIEVFESIIPVCVNSLTRACSIIEDGFRNYRDAKKPQSFDFEFLSEGTFANKIDNAWWSSETYSESERWVEGKKSGGFARWIPETHLSTLRYHTNDLLWQGYRVEGAPNEREIFKWIADEGIGSWAVASAINSLAYLYLIPEKKFDEALWYLEVAVDLEAVNQSTNALTNIGHIFFLMGDIDDAIHCLKLTLDRPDKFSESEACMLLGEIFLSRNNKEEAVKYFNRGARGSDDQFSLRCKELLKIEMEQLGLMKLNAYRYHILANEYRIQQKYPNPERDGTEYLKHFNDNLWAYQIAHSTREGYTKLTPAGEEYLDNVFIMHCNVVGIHSYTLKPLDGSEGDPEVIDDEDGCEQEGK